MSKQIKTQQLKQELKAILHTNYLQQQYSKTMPPQHLWLSTRELANAMHIDIYRARRLLLQLAAEHEVLVTDGAIKNSLRWYINCVVHTKNPEDSTLLDRGMQDYMKVFSSS